MTDEFQRYLLAKQTVDDRALDRRVLDELRSRLERRASAADGPLSVLEVGAGIGTMLTRFLEWDVLPQGAIRYTALDLSADNIDALNPHLRAWARERSVSVAATDPLVLEADDRRVEVTTAVGDAAEHAGEHRHEFDLLIGAAFLDVFDLEGLDTLVGALASGGLYYFPITFDGATRFLPAHPADGHVEQQYHGHMDQKPGGDSRAGDTVLAQLQQLAETEVLAVAGSDWFVRPVDQTYPADEAYFLSYIIDTIEGAVGELSEADDAKLAEWLSVRRDQIEAAELSYVTHQLDVLGRIEAPGVPGQDR